MNRGLLASLRVPPTSARRRVVNCSAARNAANQENFHVDR